MVRLTHKQISARIKKLNKELVKTDADFLKGKITYAEYQKLRKPIYLKKMFPLQRAGLVLANPHIYGYPKKSITLAEAARLTKKFGTGGTPMTKQDFERYYGIKYNPRRKK